MADDKENIIWRAAEYEYVEKGVGWYWTVGTLFAILALVALWQKNFFFFLFIVIAGFMTVFFGRRKARVIEFKIGEEGVHVGNLVFYKFKDLEGFDVRNRPGRLDELILKKKTAFNPYVKIPIDSHLAEKAKVKLVGKIPEFKYDESLIDILAEWIGF